MNRRWWVWTLLIAVTPMPVRAQIAPPTSQVTIPSFVLPFGHVTSPRFAAAVPPIQDTGTSLSRNRELALAIGIGGLVLASALVEEPSPLDCFPCASTEVPFFDRWVIGPTRETLDAASTALLVGEAVATWAILSRRETDAFAHVRASFESAGLAFGLTNLLKKAVGRNRPYAYADEGRELTDAERDAARSSWPSGHTSAAVALATSFVLSSTDRISNKVRIGVVAAAGVTGILRVAAGWHFPSDVVSGAAIGVGSSFVVHTIRF